MQQERAESELEWDIVPEEIIDDSSFVEGTNDQLLQTEDGLTVSMEENKADSENNDAETFDTKKITEDIQENMRSTDTVSAPIKNEVKENIEIQDAENNMSPYFEIERKVSNIDQNTEKESVEENVASICHNSETNSYLDLM